MYPTISIVTPSYNQGSFIEDCIRSVISQQGDFEIDYIIVDGGSTDSSLEIIRKYDLIIKGGKWPVKCRGIRYRWLSEPDRGQSHAINKGLSMGTGEVVAWLNSDDYYYPGAFARAAAFLKNDKSLAMIYGEGDVVDKGGRVEMKYTVEPLFDLWKLIHLYDFIMQPSVFMRHEALKCSGYLNEQLHYIMDWELWIRLSRFGKIMHIPEKLSCARVHPEAKTQSSGLDRWREIKWCSGRYGHMKLPPVIFTQLFHRPVNVMFGNRPVRENTVASSVFGLLRRAYYALIRDNKSSIYVDGCVERIAFLSIPLRQEISKLTIRIKPLFSNHIRYFVNSGHSGAIELKRDITAIKIDITDEIKRSGFLHIKFISDKDTNIAPLPMTFVVRRGSFLIQDILLQMEDGSEVKDIGLPEFRRD